MARDPRCCLLRRRYVPSLSPFIYKNCLHVMVIRWVLSSGMPSNGSTKYRAHLCGIYDQTFRQQVGRTLTSSGVGGARNPDAVAVVVGCCVSLIE
jgi:hypothetical protein